MKIEIEDNIIKYYLRNAYFITGTAYAGKSTMVKMLSEKYDMMFCGENYHSVFPADVLVPEKQPALCFFQTMQDWQEFINRTPEKYEKWIYDGAEEAAGIEITELIRLSALGKRIIVDTNIPLSILHVISEYNHVAVMLSPQSMSVEKFFERTDEDKQFLLKQIESAKDPEMAMTNFKACIARINSKEHYDEFVNSGFFTVVREESDIDTKENILASLAKHFGFD